MADTQGLPPGVTLDPQPHDAAPAGVPSGVTLDAQPHDASTISARQPGLLEWMSDDSQYRSAQPGILQHGLGTAEGLVAGSGKFLKTQGEGLINLGVKAANAMSGVTAPDIGADPKDARKIPEIVPDPHLDLQGGAEHVGAGATEMAEWAAQEAGLEKFVKLLGTPPAILKLIEDHPTASKIILDTMKGGIIGSTQGAVKGAAEGDAVGGAERGAVGGATGGLVAAGTGAALEKVGLAAGIGRNSLDEATRSGKPGKRNIDWAEDWQRALPKLADKYQDTVKGSGVEGVADAALDASHDVWNTEVVPLIKKHENDLKNVSPVADAVRDNITPSLTKLSPDKAKGVEQIANLYAGPGPKSMMSLGEMEKEIEHLNAELTDDGWWKKSASDRAAAIKAGNPMGAKSVAADKLRDLVYDHIDSFKDNNIRELKKTYGALRNVEHEFRGQVNVQGRQSVVSLKQMLGATTGAAAGGPAGIAAAVLPFLDKHINSPDAMAERAVKSAVPDKPITAAAKKIGKALIPAAKTGGAVTGEMVADKGVPSEGTENNPE